MEKIKKKQKKSFDPASLLLAIGFITADIFLWYRVFFIAAPSPTQASVSPRFYFLDVGQGDAEVVALPGGVTIMTDAGPDTKVLESLPKALPQGDTYIDIAIISHPQLDHFGGYNFILDHYRVGAFIYNGRSASPGNAAWSALVAKIKKKNIPLITLGEGDVIRYGNNEIDILSPDPDFAQSGALNDTGLVELIKAPPLRALFTADIGFNIESALLAQHQDLRADILKIAHHESKDASSAAFLRAVNPRAAVIEVGAKNSYGQPASLTLGEIASSTSAQVFRTDRDGTISIWENNGAIEVAKML